MQLQLLGIAGPFKGMRFSFAQGETTIGRDPENHCWTSDPSLSRRHCLLRCEADHVSIKDLGSRNGTIVNGIPVSEQELQHQDQICIGDSLLVFLKEDAIDSEKSSSVILTQTAEIGPATVLADPQALSPSAKPGELAMAEIDRTSRHLNALLTIATRIGGIRNRESLEWQLLGMIFDIVPADRAAILHCGKNCEQFDSAIAWDRMHGPGEPVEVSSAVVRRVFHERVGLLNSDVASERNLARIEPTKSAALWPAM